jgi:hypothetical protein
VSEPSPIRPMPAAWAPTPGALPSAPAAPLVAAGMPRPRPAALVGLAVSALGMVLALLTVDDATGSLLAPVGFLVVLVAMRGTRRASGRESWVVPASDILTCLSILLT